MGARDENRDRTPRGLLAEYNTKLTPEEEAAFALWAGTFPDEYNKMTRQLRDGFDYDLRGFWKAGLKQGSNGHGSDLFKKPNHPTFSVDSLYASEEMPGGVWTELAPARGDKIPPLSTYEPSDTNYLFETPRELVDYMKDVEPMSILLPKRK